MIWVWLLGAIAVVLLLVGAAENRRTISITGGLLGIAVFWVAVGVYFWGAIT